MNTINCSTNFVVITASAAYHALATVYDARRTASVAIRPNKREEQGAEGTRRGFLQYIDGDWSSSIGDSLRCLVVGEGRQHKSPLWRKQLMRS